MDTILKAEGVTKNFGSLTAVDHVSLRVEENEILGIVGPNGAGKTTLLNLITGFQDLDYGRIFFRAKDITGLPPHELADLGIVRTFQLTTMFREFTIEESLKVALPEDVESGKEKIDDIIKFLDLEGVRKELTKNLSYGQKKLLQLGCVVARDPTLILLDEPAGGINPVLLSRILNYIQDLRQEGKTFLMVEHDMDTVSKVCDRIVVLNFGKKISEGTYEEICRDEKVQKAYLGES